LGRKEVEESRSNCDPLSNIANPNIFSPRQTLLLTGLLPPFRQLDDIFVMRTKATSECTMVHSNAFLITDVFVHEIEFSGMEDMKDREE
jgi:hypothetical protein